jgi:hypothetical protein
MAHPLLFGQFLAEITLQTIRGAGERFETQYTVGRLTGDLSSRGICISAGLLAVTSGICCTH